MTASPKNMYEPHAIINYQRRVFSFSGFFSIIAGLIPGLFEDINL